jgi:hypothetical protein
MHALHDSSATLQCPINIGPLVAPGMLMNNTKPHRRVTARLHINCDCEVRCHRHAQLPTQAIAAAAHHGSCGHSYYPGPSPKST